MTTANNTATFVAKDDQVRLDEAAARHALDAVMGLTAQDAVHLLRFSPVYRCPQVARLIETAARTAERVAGVGPADLLVDTFGVGEGEDIVRVRRKAHGMADWITTTTLELTVQLRKFEDNGTEMPA